MLSNTNGNVVTLANNNEISGLFLENTGSSYAIYGTNITNASVSNCTIAGANAQGYGGFYTTELAGALTIDNCSFSQNYGVYLTNSQTNLQASITDSLFGGGTGTTASITWELANTIQGVLTAEGNTFNSYYTGIEVDSSGTSALTATINNNVMTGGGYGIYMNATTATNALQNLTINGNTITTYYQSPYFIQNGSLNANIVGNNVNSVYYCLEVDSLSGMGSVTAAANTMTTSDEYNIYFNHSGGDFAASFTGNQLVAVDDYVIYSNMSGTANNHALNMRGNTLSGDYGWYLVQPVGNAASTWTNNTITAYDPIYIDQTGGSTAGSMSLSMTGNTIAGEYGVYIDQTSGIFNGEFNNNMMTTITNEEAIYWGASGDAVETNLSIVGNQLYSYYSIEGSQSVGNLNAVINDNVLGGNTSLILSLTTPGTTTLSMDGNTCYGEYPIEITQTAGTSVLTLTDNAIAAGLGNGFTYTGAGTANSFQTLSGNTIAAAGSGVNPVKLALSTTGMTSTTLTNNIFSGGANNTILSTLGAGTQILNISNNKQANSGGYSLAAIGGQATWLVNDNQFLSSTLPPIVAQTSGGNACMQLNGNTAYPTAGAYQLTNSGGPSSSTPLRAISAKSARPT